MKWEKSNVFGMKKLGFECWVLFFIRFYFFICEMDELI